MENYVASLIKHKLPRYNELPDFELYMDQVISLMQKYLSPYILSDDALTPSMINNYVKMNVLPAPEKKKYNKDHLAQLIVICLMKRQLSIPTINAIILEQIKHNGLETFYNSFAELYEYSSQDAAKKTNETDSLLTLALSLAISASASHAIAENAVRIAIPPVAEENEKPKKEEKKKEEKPKKEKEQKPKKEDKPKKEKTKAE